VAILPNPAESRALLVGVSRYTALEQLPSVANNLVGLHATLTDPRIWGLRSEHCTILPEPHSAEEVVNTLARVAASATGALVVYFAGHGLVEPENVEELYLALPAANRGRIYINTLPYSGVRREMRNARVPCKVVILDCCYSGRATTLMGHGQSDLANRLAIEGTCILTATAGTRYALAPPGERFTAFTGELITLLNTGIPGGPKLLSMATLFEHLQSNLRGKELPLPQCGQLNSGGDIALGRNVAAGQLALSPEVENSDIVGRLPPDGNITHPWENYSLFDWPGRSQSELRVSDTPVSHTSAHPVALVFNRRTYTEPVKLAAAFRREWAEARRLLDGQQARTPGFLALRDWTASHLGDSAWLLERSTPSDRLLAQLILALDPASPAEFAGRQINPRGLLALAREAASKQHTAEPAADLLDTIYKDGILTVYEGVVDCAGYVILDDYWRRLVQVVEDRFANLEIGSLTPAQSRAVRIAMLLAALAPDQITALSRRADRAFAEPKARCQLWFRRLGQPYPEEDMEPARYQLLIMTKKYAVEQTKEFIAAENLRTEQVERRRKMAVRDRNTSIIQVMGLIAFLSAIGPVAIGFGMRGLSRGGGEFLGRLCLYGGILETIADVAILHSIFGPR
jgi:hypothetical protein